MTVKNDINRILIVSHTFPPDAGIGGRRWAKFARALEQKGIKVEVIAAALRTAENSIWSGDAAHIRVHRYAHQYPKALTTHPNSIAEKLAYRAALARVKLSTSGTPYDRAVFDKTAFLKVFRIQMQTFLPDAVVVTGPPFNLMDYVSEVRSDYPDVKFIADFRDPWMGGSLYGYAHLDAKASSAEYAKEKRVMEIFDAITSPWPAINTDLRERYAFVSERISLLSHTWDPEDFVLPVKDLAAKTCDLIYGGNLYQGFDKFFGFLSKFALEAQKSVEIFTNSPAHSMRPLTNDYFNLMEPLSAPEFFGRLQKADRLLFLIPEGLKDGFPTKLLEYAASGRPLVAVGFGGSLSKTVEDRGLGVFLSLEDVNTRFPEMMRRPIKYHPDLEWIAQHTVRVVTDRLLETLKTLKIK